MTTKAQGWEGGSDGNPITTTASASTGDQLSTSTGSGAGTRVFQASGALKGGTSARITCSNTTDTMIMGWDSLFSGASGTGLAFRLYFKVFADTTASGATYILFRNTTPSNAFSVIMNTGLSLRVSGNTGTLVTGSAATLTTNTLYRMEMLADPGTSTSNGRVKYALYLGDDTASPLVNIDVSGLNLGGVTLAGLRWGKTGSVGTNDWLMDDIIVSDTQGMSTFIGPSINQSPVVSVGSALTTALGSASSMTATASDPDGTIASYSWTQLTGPTVTLTGATTATASFTASAAAHYSFRCTVTDNLGATASADKIVYVTSTVSRPETLVSNTGGWSVTGAASLPAALSDETNTSYIQSPTSPSTAQACRFGMTPLSAGSTTVSYTHDQSASSPQMSTTFTLLQGPGMTTIAQWVETPTTTITTATHTLTSGQQASLTDGNNLYLDVSTIV